MFDNMPDQLKEQVRKFLEDDDFIGAKEVYDRWHREHKQPETYHQNAQAS